VGEASVLPVCKRLAKDGYDILLTYTTSSRPAEFVVDAIREAGGDALAVKIDCAAEDEVALLASHPWMARSVDALVLNHGRYDRVPAGELDVVQLDRTMAVNFRGAFLVWGRSPAAFGQRRAHRGGGFAAGDAWLTPWRRLQRLEGGFASMGPLAGSRRRTARSARQRSRARVRGHRPVVG